MSARKGVSLQKIQDIGVWRLILPTLLGLGVVGYLMWKNFDKEEFQRIAWNEQTVFWVGLAICLYIIRHLAYSWRLRILSDSFFSFKKSIQLIFLWEFASTITPTALGGSATALVLLSQERFPGAKAVTIILYSVVLDTLFFLVSLPILLFILGPVMIRPEMLSIWDANGFGITFWSVLGLMLAYGLFFFYGLFVNPKQIRNILYFISKWRIFRRFRKNLQKTADDVIIASRELKTKNTLFHIKALGATCIAWGIRFTIIPLLVFAFIQTMQLGSYDFTLLWARYETMFSITAFSPTPGGSGVAEALFGGFFKDYILKENAFIIALIWRGITYYSYLIIGMIILPNWINHILVERKKRKLKKESEQEIEDLSKKTV